jgi:hypothetical protein
VGRSHLSEPGAPFVWRAGVLICLLFVIGCGDRLSSVTGRISYKGKPLSAGTVTFVSPTGPAATGEIGKDGSYKLLTPGKGGGAIPGSYNVAFRSLAPVNPNDHSPDRRLTLTIPEKYMNHRISGVRAEVKEGANVIDFDLE